jgi:hypothetical protein
MRDVKAVGRGHETHIQRGRMLDRNGCLAN